MNDVGAVIDFVRIVGTQLSVMQIEYLIGENGYNLERSFYVQSYAAVRHRSPAGYGVLL